MNQCRMLNLPQKLVVLSRLMYIGKGWQSHCVVQANAVSDKVLDLRKCDYKGANLNGKQLPGALMSESDFTGAQMVEATLTKVGSPLLASGCISLTAIYLGYSRLHFALQSYAKGANFSGAPNWNPSL